ncbi:MAG: ATP-binding protein [Bacteroidota bacterium]
MPTSPNALISILLTFFYLSSASLQAQIFSVEHQDFQREFFQERTCNIADFLEILADQNGQFSYPAVANKRFDDNPPEIQLTPKDQYWIRFQVQGHSERDSTFIFRIGKGALSCKLATVYLSNSSKIQITGSDISIAQKPLKTYANYFIVPLQSKEIVTVYINLQGFYPYHRDKANRLEIYHSDKQLEATFVPQKTIYWNGILLGTVLIPILYFLTLFFIQRERLHLFYVIMVSSALLVFIFNLPNNYIFPIFPTNPDLSRTIWWIGVYFTIFGLLKFTIAYLELPKHWQGGIRLINNWLIFKAILIALEIPYISYYLPDFLLTIVQFLQRITTFLSLLIPVVLGVMAVRKNNKLASYFLIACTVFIVGSTFHTLAPLFSWYDYGNHPLIASYVLYISFLAMLILLAIGTGHKMNLLERKKTQANQLKELDAIKTKLYTNITHEFRTPLTVIQGMSKNIKGHDKAVELIQRNADNLLDLINEILDLSKLESGKAQLELQQSDIIQFLRYLSNSFHSLARSKDLHLTFSSLEKKLMMDFDSNKLTQILYNLISNAIKFTPQYGSISVTAQRQEKQLMIAVQDNGIGISEADLEHIFDRFQQASNESTNKEKGSGIGLSLVQELVKLMDGRIEVDSELGRGTTFLVHLPIRNNAPLKDAITDTDMLEEVNSNETVPKIEIKQEKVSDLSHLLIIEDTRDVVIFLEDILQDQYQISIAYDGEAGIQTALKEVPDIIISDVMMPKKNGMEVVSTLKKDVRTSHIPIILLTARGDQEGKLEGLEVGADAYLVKPFNEKELFIRLRKLIENRQRLQQKYSGLASFTDNVTNAPADDPELQFLQKLEQVVKENMGNENFKVEPYLCRAMLMSRPQLYRKIKALLDKSPSQYIRYIRMQHAYHLLINTDIKIGDISDKVGYRDHANFSKAYFAEFGETPSETREKYKSKG